VTPKQALALWHEALRSALTGEAPVLSTRQMAVMLTVYLDAPPHTLRSLAKGLRVSESATARALDVLERHDYVRRRRDQEDRRNLLVQRTVQGAVFVHDFGELVAKLAVAVDADPIPSPPR
jgi:DNA-binding MarR family transcriptional regulator